MPRERRKIKRRSGERTGDETKIGQTPWTTRMARDGTTEGGNEREREREKAKKTREEARRRHEIGSLIKEAGEESTAVDRSKTAFSS